MAEIIWKTQEEIEQEQSDNSKDNIGIMQEQIDTLALQVLDLMGV